MTHEESAVWPTSNLELFITDVLKYSSKLSCYHIAVLKDKVIETIIITRTNHFNTPPYQGGR